MKPTYKLINSDVELKDDLSSSYNLFSTCEGERPLIYAERISDGLLKAYKLTKDITKIKTEDRYEILEAVLSKVTQEDEVTLSDVFIHGQYIELTKSKK